MTQLPIVREYQILSKLGEGGMGQVWLAKHRFLETMAAVKILAPNFRKVPQFERRFMIEAQAQARLKHPNIVEVRDFFAESGHYFLITEYVDGMDLSVLLSRNGPLPLDLALRIFKQILRAVNYAHSSGIIHRDIKPGNILVNSEWTAKIMDFGLAYKLGVHHPDAENTIMGSPPYMSPEQIREPALQDHRIDVYAMGVVLYELLTGHLPFEGKTTQEIWHGHLTRMPARPRKYAKDLDPIWEQALLKALQKNPNNRYSGCGEFLSYIEQYEKTTKAEVGRSTVTAPASHGTSATGAATPETERRTDPVAPPAVPAEGDAPDGKDVNDATEPDPGTVSHGPSGNTLATVFDFLSDLGTENGFGGKYPRLVTVGAVILLFCLFFFPIAFIMEKLTGANIPFMPIGFRSVFGLFFETGSSGPAMGLTVFFNSLALSGAFIAVQLKNVGHRKDRVYLSLVLSMAAAVFNALAIFEIALPSALYHMANLGLLERVSSVSPTLSPLYLGVALTWYVAIAAMGALAFAGTLPMRAE